MLVGKRQAAGKAAVLLLFLGRIDTIRCGFITGW